LNEKCKDTPYHLLQKKKQKSLGSTSSMLNCTYALKKNKIYIREKTFLLVSCVIHITTTFNNIKLGEYIGQVLSVHSIKFIRI
jgi:hypothetical protein